MRADNLFLHTDGGYYCLLSDDAPMKRPDTGDWIPGVVYTGVDQKLRSTATSRWLERFAKVAEYDGDDEEVLAMIRRCNPEPFALGDILDTWQALESQVNAEVLELMAATVAASRIWTDPNLPVFDMNMKGNRIVSVAFTVEPRHLAYTLQNYQVEREPDGRGYRFIVRK